MQTSLFWFDFSDRGLTINPPWNWALADAIKIANPKRKIGFFIVGLSRFYTNKKFHRNIKLQVNGKLFGSLVVYNWEMFSQLKFAKLYVQQKFSPCLERDNFSWAWSSFLIITNRVKVSIIKRSTFEWKFVFQDFCYSNDSFLCNRRCTAYIN